MKYFDCRRFSDFSCIASSLPSNRFGHSHNELSNLNGIKGIKKWSYITPKVDRFFYGSRYGKRSAQSPIKSAARGFKFNFLRWQNTTSNDDKLLNGHLWNNSYDTQDSVATYNQSFMINPNSTYDNIKKLHADSAKFANYPKLIDPAM